MAVPREGVYGLLAEFNTPGELVRATEAAHAAGFRRMECYTPYPVEEAATALHFHKTRVPMICLLGRLDGSDDRVPNGDVDQRVCVSVKHRGGVRCSAGRRSSSRRMSGRSCLRDFRRRLGCLR